MINEEKENSKQEIYERNNGIYLEKYLKLVVTNISLSYRKYLKTKSFWFGNDTRIK